MYLNINCNQKERLQDLLSKMSLDQKVGQMILAEWPHISVEEMETFQLGSLLSGGESSPVENDLKSWRKIVHDYQSAVLNNSLKIPALFGIDAVHGHNNVQNATIFPHNIGLGAADDEKNTFLMGQIVAKAIFASGFNWNFAPCVALANDPRWGRTYESFSTNVDIVNRLALAYTRGQISKGMITCAKHFIGDGGTKFGTGLNDKSDRGNTILSEEAIENSLLIPYQTQVKAGVQTIMPSYSSLNGTKMHQNEHYLQRVLKTKLGFGGLVVSDWEAVREIPNANFEEQIWISVNAGVDMLMEPIKWKAAYFAVKRGVENGRISMERINDAVTRILSVKFAAGLFDDPLVQKKDKFQFLRTKAAQKVAQTLAEKSLVLLKNEHDLLPIKAGTNVFVTGEGADNMGLQCGGWTIDWNGFIDQDGVKSTAGVTILEGLREVAIPKKITILTDRKQAKKADIVLQVLSEKPYAEMAGDSTDIEITGSHGHKENTATISFCQSLQKPIITILLGGRHFANLENHLSSWKSCLMAYLPGSEGGTAIANVLLGKQDFVGKLPMPWYKTVADIEKESPNLLFELGYGLNYTSCK